MSRSGGIPLSTPGMLRPCAANIDTPAHVHYPFTFAIKRQPLYMKNWLMFGLLGLIWGSSFLLIKIGVQELNAFELVSGRLGFTALAFALTLVIMRRPLPRDPKTWAVLAVVGVTNTVIPFVLITSGEQMIDSGLASVLNATTPLFSIVIAHLALSDDRLYGGKILGLLAGFVGVIILASRSVDPNHPNPLPGQIAILVAAFFYAISAVIIRPNLRPLQPTIPAGPPTPPPPPLPIPLPPPYPPPL